MRPARIGDTAGAEAGWSFAANLARGDGGRDGLEALLDAALYTPVFTAGVSGVITLSIAVVCYAALTSWKVPAWAVVIGAALVGWVVL